MYHDMYDTVKEIRGAQTGEVPPVDVDALVEALEPVLREIVRDELNKTHLTG